MWSGVLQASWLPPFLALCSLAGLYLLSSLESLEKSLLPARLCTARLAVHWPELIKENYHLATVPLDEPFQWLLSQILIISTWTLICCEEFSFYWFWNVLELFVGASHFNKTPPACFSSEHLQRVWSPPPHYPQNTYTFPFFLQKKSREESCGEGSGVEILENKPYKDGPGGSGQYTHKVYHIGMHIPSWFRSILPKAALRVEEESWNAYPYTRTRWSLPLHESLLHTPSEQEWGCNKLCQKRHRTNFFSTR